MSTHRETRNFNGNIYYRYPNAKSLSDRRYFRTSGWNGNPRFLHRDVWEHYNGPIPPGHHIHHKDDNADNNDISNLECLHADDHFSHHFKERKQSDQWWRESRARMDHARIAAAEWHGSEEGLAWHSKHGKEVWEMREEKAATCTHCGAEYKSHFPRGFCSNNCKSAARRASGVDNVERACGICGGTFTANKYSKTRFCSRKCGGVARRKRGADVK